MSDTPKTSLSLPLGREREYFPPEIVFDKNDNDRCSPVIYLPYVVIAEKQPLNNVLKKTAWQVYKKKLLAEYAEAKAPEDVPELSEKSKEESDGEGNSIIYIPLEEDGGETTLGKTKELKLARYGKQIVRVYGPGKIKVWETKVFSTPYDPTSDFQSFPELVETEVDLTKDEKLIIFHQLPQKADDMETEFHIDTSDPDPKDYDGRAGSMDFKNESSYKEGRFFQQQKEVDTFSIASYTTEFEWLGRKFVRTFIIPGNRGEYREKQVRKIGRKKCVIREVLRFNGSVDQSIKYWYDDPVVTVLSWTQFIDEEGKQLDYRPNNAAFGKDFEREKKNFTPKKGRTFHADKKCWGSMWVEYETSYTEFEIYYDFPQPTRTYEILAGNIERVGYQVVDKKGKVIDRGDNLEGCTLEYDMKVSDPDWIRENKAKISPTNLPPEIAVRLCKKIQMQSFTTTSIDILYTNGRQAASATFNPPEPNFMDMPVDELPKVAIFEKLVREKKGGVAVDHVEEVTLLDIMGNVTSEKIEKRRDAEEV